MITTLVRAENLLDEAPSISTCIYCNQPEGECLDVYQLCFDDDRLTSKNSY